MVLFIKQPRRPEHPNIPTKGHIKRSSISRSIISSRGIMTRARGGGRCPNGGGWLPLFCGNHCPPPGRALGIGYHHQSCRPPRLLPDEAREGAIIMSHYHLSKHHSIIRGHHLQFSITVCHHTNPLFTAVGLYIVILSILQN